MNPYDGKDQHGDHAHQNHEHHGAGFDGSPFAPDDPRLTAYVLGELSPEACAALERELENSPQLQAAVAEIRETTELLSAEFQREPVLELSDAQRIRLNHELRNCDSPTRALATQPHGRRRGALVCVMAASVAACAFAVLAWQPESDPAVPPHQALIARIDNQPAISDENVDGYLQTPASSREVARAERANGKQTLMRNDIKEIGQAFTMESRETTPAAVSRDANVAVLSSNGAVPGNESASGEVFGRQSAVIANSDVAKKLPETSGSTPTWSRDRVAQPQAPVAAPTPDRPASPSRAIVVTESVPPTDAYGGSLGAAPLGMEARLTKLAQSSGPAMAPGEGTSPPQAALDEYSTAVKDAIVDRSNVAEVQMQRLDPKAVASLYSKLLGGSGKTASPGDSTPTATPQLAQTAVDQNGRQLGRAGKPAQKVATAPVGEGERHWYYYDPAGDRPHRELAEAAAGISGEAIKESLLEREHLDGLRRHRFVPRRPPSSNESYQVIVENNFLSPVDAPLSTFSVDVDTAAFSNVRRFLDQGQWPDPNAVRIEEMLNYFTYDDPAPADGRPFSVRLEAGTCPWNEAHRLVRIGIRGREIDAADRPNSNLVFLLDVSGSMKDQNKLPLVKAAMSLLVEEMTENDRIGIVTYANSAAVVMDPTSGSDKAQILSCINNLNASGSTNGEGGLKLAYELAQRHFDPEGTNRIILCTDGDFNVGQSSDSEMIALVEQRAKSGIALSVFGFGMGNLKDSKLEGIADHGNGHYGYIDSLREARRMFVEELTGTLYTIAGDVKLQLEFNPQHVGAYRLIGYENRLLKDADFNNDAKDAGDIGAGHRVTALYEIVPPGLSPVHPQKGLKYQTAVVERAEVPAGVEGPAQRELLTLSLRYKLPGETTSQLMEVPFVDERDENPTPSGDLQWASSVAAFAMLLRESQYAGEADFDKVLAWATAGRGSDPSGKRREFIDMIHLARTLDAQRTGRAQSRATPVRLSDEAAREKAACGGKYRRLLQRIEVPDDYRKYGYLHEFGKWDGKSYAGFEQLPEGFWVYAYPHWYIWGECEEGGSGARQ